MKNFFNKNKKITILVSIILLILIIGATYAYFTLSNGEDAQGGVHITSNTTDSLMFEIERDISLTLDTDNFLSEMGNQSDNVWAKAELLPNNKTNEAHDLYNMYFVITDNEFDYATVLKKAEILLKVIDTKGTDTLTDDEVIDDEVDGLNYVTITDGKSVSHSGYDITKAYGLYKIISEKGIDANGGSETHNYKIEVVFINYNENQSKNAGRNLDATILLSKEDYKEYEPTFVNVMNVEKSSSSITTSLNITDGTSEIDKYYFKAEEVIESPTAYVESKSNVVKLAQEDNNDGFVERNSASYTFDAVANKKYTVYAYTVDKLGIKSNIYKQVVVNDDKVLPVISSIESDVETSKIKITITTSSSNISEYCYSINKEKYECTNSNIHTFNDVNSLLRNNISVYIKDSSENKSTIYNFMADKLLTLAKYIIKLYNEQSSEGAKGIYLHDGRGTYSNLEACWTEDGTTKCENSYRYSGASTSVENYVCFGGECDNTGTSENLYRIVGVFDGQVKLIKATEATTSLLGTNGAYSGNGNGYYWDRGSDYNNVWSHSLLNTLNLNSGYTTSNKATTVNYGFLYTIDHGSDNKNWSSYITEHTWKVGGSTSDIIQTNNARTVYQKDVRSTNGEINYTNKIGLMYVSDYMYSGNPVSSMWSTTLNGNQDIISNSWLRYQSAKNEAIITPAITVTYPYHISNSYGYVSTSPYLLSCVVRPAFYLNTNVIKIDGNGKKTSPYKIIL